MTLIQKGIPFGIPQEAFKLRLLSWHHIPKQFCDVTDHYFDSSILFRLEYLSS